MASFLSPQLKRLLGYMRPYAVRLSLGVILLAFVAIAEGGVAFMIKLAVDFVLRPAATRAFCSPGRPCKWPGTIQEFLPMPPSRWRISARISVL